jgi:hypothetical protein
MTFPGAVNVQLKGYLQGLLPAHNPLPTDPWPPVHVALPVEELDTTTVKAVAVQFVELARHTRSVS